MSVQSPMPSDYSSGLLLIERDMYGGEDEEHAARLGGRKEVGWRQQYGMKYASILTLCRHSKQIFGLLVVFGIVASWAGSAELANYSEKRAHFDKPFFIVYLNSAWNVLILPLFLGFQFLSSRVSKLFCTSGSEEEELTLNPIMDIHKLLEQEDMSVKKLFFASAISVFNLSIADYLYFRALSLTSASSGIVIFNLSSIVTYFLSLFLLDEEFSILKGFAVLLSFGGAALVVFSDKISGGGKLPSSVIDDDSHEWVGDLVMAGGATFWGIYLVCCFIGTRITHVGMLQEVHRRSRLRYHQSPEHFNGNNQPLLLLASVNHLTLHDRGNLRNPRRMDTKHCCCNLSFGLCE